ncbi:zinc finger protein-domain-containing protein [Chaetomium fimeti]|uniref:Zinc finger protein-domain-containing protein n=1 Tax=Chaetomium fimeti TaxID=1854472 RepID=A0AAE0HFS0_9PEZI|nr:zinc finger protein-domain-containing protein [Chaetomium fimeti]
MLSFDRDIPIHPEIHGNEPFTKIGAGICGAVFARQGKSYAIKLSKTKSHKVLWNDYLMHVKIAHCFKLWEFDEVSIPACHYFAPPNESQFFAQHPGLAEAAEQVCHLPTSALVTERILPLPARVRALIIDNYCAEHIKEEARADAASKDCLVRVYLGSTKGKSCQQFFSLRNFKMHLNHMTELQLDIRTLAQRMGMAMALIHWAAETDGRGVEFVLGNSSKTVSRAIDPGKLCRSVKPLSYTGPHSRQTEDFFGQVAATKLWVLDFDQVQPITMDRDGVAQAVDAVRLNDPFIPKPMQATADERKTWDAFAMSYLETADVILEVEGKDVLDLPRLFIEGLVEAESQRQLARAIVGAMT